MRPSDCAAAKVNLRTNEEDFIASLDPLNVDSVISIIPLLNKIKDTNSLVRLAGQIIPSIADVQSFDYYECNAVTRDIGFLLGSLKRHGIEPRDAIWNLEIIMNLLSEKTFLPPRDTLLHYTIWNPSGPRRRTYTGTADENYLIDSVVTAMDPLVKAIHLLTELHRTAIHCTAFRDICDRITVHFQKVIDGIVLARRKVSLSYFSKELRLYFDPIIIDDREYLGPGAVEMPMFVFDHLLWSSNCVDNEYNTFKKTYVPYIHWEIREIYHRFENSRSLVDKCFDAIITKDIAFDPIVRESVKGLCLCMQQLKSFRMPHRKVAEEAYSHVVHGQGVNGCPGETDCREFRDSGSGGYSPGILSHILKLSNQQMEKLNACMSFYGQEMIFKPTP